MNFVKLDIRIIEFISIHLIMSLFRCLFMSLDVCPKGLCPAAQGMNLVNSGNQSFKKEQVAARLFEAKASFS